MLIFDEIQNKVYEYGSLINAPKHYLKIFPAPQSDGRPYIKIESDKYKYRIDERGMEIICKETNDIDILLYWIMLDIVSLMANQYELLHRVERVDNRIIMFGKKIELMRKLNSRWGELAEIEVNQILKRSPFVEPVNKTV